MSLHNLSAILECDLQPTPKLTLLLIDSLANENDQSYPSIGYLASRLKVSERTVINTIDFLVQDGWLKKERRSLANGKQTSNLYTVMQVAREMGGVKNLQGGGEDSAPSNYMSLKRVNSTMPKPSSPSSKRAPNGAKNKKISPDQGMMASTILNAYPFELVSGKTTAKEKAMAKGAIHRLVKDTGKTYEDVLAQTKRFSSFLRGRNARMTWSAVNFFCNSERVMDPQTWYGLIKNGRSEYTHDQDFSVPGDPGTYANERAELLSLP